MKRLRSLRYAPTFFLLASSFAMLPLRRQSFGLSSRLACANLTRTARDFFALPMIDFVTKQLQLFLKPSLMRQTGWRNRHSQYRPGITMESHRESRTYETPEKMQLPR